MENKMKHFWHILLFYYRKGKNAVRTRKKLREVYMEIWLSFINTQKFEQLHRIKDTLFEK
ncbi:hypothetical protein WN51_03829 [Melipona quadrifasciata]|uniref:Mos1 transposase HTH domain-containing protein n=1 Tax=Melipona quadrifasciata TaxID=166423 RepID=A0A0M9AAV8_9HYME|nr:hypothetical protein WN51_03829 [Melipona quadrifasciata]